MDVFSQRILGWAIATTMATRLVQDALAMAVWTRVHHGRPIPGGRVRQHRSWVSTNIFFTSGRPGLNGPVARRSPQEGHRKLVLVLEGNTEAPMEQFPAPYFSTTSRGQRATASAGDRTTIFSPERASSTEETKAYPMIVNAVSVVANRRSARSSSRRSRAISACSADGFATRSPECLPAQTPASRSLRHSA